MAARIRLGMIGAGFIAQVVHLPACTGHSRAEVVALCGRDQARTDEAAKKFGIPTVYTDYRAMLERADLDAVVISSPDDLHYSMTIDALDAGLHVLCEKPMALTLADARAMLARAEMAGVKHMVNFLWRTLPAYQYLLELIDEGYLGQPYQWAINYVAGYGRDGAYRWRFDRRRANGILGDLGSHMADLARWLVGDIAEVSATLRAFVARPGPDGGALDPANDAATIALRFANGAQGAIQVSAVAHMGDRGQEQHAVLYGERGTLEADFSFGGGWEVRGARADEPQIRALPIPKRILGNVDQSQSHFDQWKELLLTQSFGPRAFIDAIAEDRPASPNFADGVKAQEVIEAALRSDEVGGWVSLT